FDKMFKLLRIENRQENVMVLLLLPQRRRKGRSLRSLKPSRWVFHSLRPKTKRIHKKTTRRLCKFPSI
ncbi:hypothetical protein PMAYCL1PPCAC_15730, partial [Pristionchus mayeri]